MKILFVTEKFPYPLDTGGNVRTFQILKALSAEHTVTLLSNRPVELDKHTVDPVRSICANIQWIGSRPASRLRTIRRVTTCLVENKSLILERHCARDAEMAIQRLMVGDDVRQRQAQGAKAHRRKIEFDAIHFNHLDTAPYEKAVPPAVLRILDQHNVVTNQVRTTLRVEKRPLHQWALRRESNMLPTVESNLCNRMDLCITCSDADRESLRALGVRSRIETVPNGVDLEHFSLTPDTPRSLAAVFVGTLDYDPCDKAIQHFCATVLPKLHRKYPGLTFIAVGRNPSEKVRRFADQDDRIVLTGRVEDVRPFVRTAAVFVVPLLSGSGTRLKILEALALGTPVVTTRIGVEGIDVTPDSDLLIANSPDEFASAVSRIIDDEALARRLSQNGRLLVEQRYGWSASHARLLGYYRQVTEKRQERNG